MAKKTLTLPQQKLIMLIYDSGFITRKCQDLYVSKFFYNRIGEMIHRGLVASNKNYTNYNNQYTLTDKGMILAKILKGEEL